MDHPLREEKVYAIEAMVVEAVARIERARGARDVCDFSDVSRYGEGKLEQPSDAAGFPVPPTRLALLAEGKLC
jgi:hypothetical protein